MSYLGRWEIDDLLTFPVNTHADTGEATDADAVPAYRLYEDETGTAILTGNTAKLDDANTVGFYTEQITLSAANGFEVGKSYTIYISATVGGVTGTMSYTFQVEAALALASAVSALNNLSAAQVNTEVDTALGDYDAPTRAELTSDIATVTALIDTEVSAIKTVTDALTAAGATKLALSVGTILAGSAVAGTLSTTAMTTDLTEATNDHFNGRIIIFTSGVLQYQATDITDYDGATKMLTYTALTEAPSVGDDFIIV